MRWQLGANLNGKQWFPVGTFIANVLGVLLDAISDGFFAKEFGVGTLYYFTVQSAFAKGGTTF
jgi:fluoride ion exporter CrcB/FEX